MLRAGRYPGLPPKLAPVSPRMDDGIGGRCVSASTPPQPLNNSRDRACGNRSGMRPLLHE